MIFGKLFPPRNLWSAAKRGDLSAIERFIAEGHDANAKRQTVDGETPLHVASRTGQIAAIRLLVNRGAKINGRDGDGMTPLITAATEAQNGSVIDLLLELGANINAQAKSGMTALDYAAFSCNNQLVELLIRRGAKPNVGEGRRRSSPIKHCVSGENLLGLELLVAAGADVNATDAGSSPLATAAVFGRVEYVRLLLNAGAVPNQQSDGGGHTDLMSAVAGGNLEIVKMFVKAGADKNVLNPILRKTALDIAENRDKAEIAAYLRSVGSKRAKELPASDLDKQVVPETFWQLSDEMLLSVSIQPSPPTAGAASMSVELSTRDNHCFSGTIEYRIADAPRGSGEWKRLFEDLVDDEGTASFSDSVSLVKGKNFIEFRIRGEGCEDFEYPEAWSITAN